MDRQTRMKIVKGFSVSVFCLTLAYVVVPLIAMILLSISATNRADPTDVLSAIKSFASTAYVLQLVSFAAIGCALISFVYTIALIGKWFVDAAPQCEVKATDPGSEVSQHQERRYLRTE